jgi:putative toxin-antitoxin system antitoxin component (TIGR02293 family)
MNNIAKSNRALPRKVHLVQAAVKRAKQLRRIRVEHKGAVVHSHAVALSHRLWDKHDHALKLFRTSAFDRVKIVKAGLPAQYVKVLTLCMNMPIEKFYRITGLARPTVDRKIRASKPLNQDESERVMGIARLVGQAQSLVQESGGPDDFDAARWVGDWLEIPLPALDGKAPGELMDTVDGRALVSDLLAQQQSGAYA